MAEEQAEETGEIISLDVANETLQTLDAKKRRIGLRLLPYNTVAVHPKYGPLMFEPGAFGDVDPSDVRLRMDHANPPTGLGDSFTDKPDAPYMEFVVSKTARGNDQLTLAEDGVARGASVGYAEIPGRSKLRRIGGDLVTVYPRNSVRLAEVSTTWEPTFEEGAGVMYVLHKEPDEEGQMAEAQEAPASGAAPVITAGVDYDAMAEALSKALSTAKSESKIEDLLDKFDGLIEQQRSAFSVPAAADKPKPPLHNWVEYTLRRMAGDHLGPTELKALALDDVVTTEQPGLVPDVFTADYDDLIDEDRPFLNSTRKIAPPRTGTSMTLPVITTRAVAGTQANNAEKDALTTTATKVGTGTFNYQSVFGGADISVQMINRAEPSFFDILTGDMAMAYALDCEQKAVDALLAGYTDSASGSHTPANGGTLDPEDLELGAAWVTAITVYRRAPTHIWLSAAACAAFIDAKDPTTNAPLYSNLAAAFTAGDGPGGRISGLIPIYVPALDDESVDAIVGPARGFVWAEDTALRLTADVPEKAGRDIVLAGGIFPAPRHADAFTVYTVAS